MGLYGRDLITTQEWCRAELETTEVASGPRSRIYDVAENHLYVQKAVMALTMGGL